MRAGVPGLPTPHPIGEQLPAIYLDDEFTQRLTGAFDEVLAPVFAALDSFGSYLDPSLAPDDFVDWLADWVALELDGNWTALQRRALVAHAVELHRRRGTPRGLAAQVQLLTGGEVEVVDSGGCRSADVPNPPLPGSGPPRVTVRVRVRDPGSVDAGTLRAAVVAAVPAHVAVTVDVQRATGG